MHTWGNRLTSAAVFALLVAAGVACSADESTPVTAPSTTAPSVTTVPVTTVPVTIAPVAEEPTLPGASPTTVEVTTTSHSPAFVSSVVGIDDLSAARMRASWREGCPVALADLRLVRVTHWGYDKAPHTGELVVSASHADAIVSVFSALFDARFPIERMQLVDDYGGDDQASMRANNTSAFNCREVAGRPGVLSAHSWGTAIDINPLVNPWVRGTIVDPPEGAPYADRSQPIRGGIFADDVVVQALRGIGWAWGGDWPTSKDWQHFSAGGN